MHALCLRTIWAQDDVNMLSDASCLVGRHPAMALLMHPAPPSGSWTMLTRNYSNTLSNSLNVFMELCNDSFWSHDIYSSVNPGEGSSSVALRKVSSIFFPVKGFFSIYWEFFLIWCEVKGQGCRMCTDFKALWGKFVICDIGLSKINWTELKKSACRLSSVEQYTQAILQMMSFLDLGDYLCLTRIYFNVSAWRSGAWRVCSPVIEAIHLILTSSVWTTLKVLKDIIFHSKGNCLFGLTQLSELRPTWIKLLQISSFPTVHNQACHFPRNRRVVTITASVRSGNLHTVCS